MLQFGFVSTLWCIKQYDMEWAVTLMKEHDHFDNGSGRFGVIRPLIWWIMVPAAVVHRVRQW